MTTTYTVADYKAHNAAIDRLIDEAGVDQADCYAIDVHRWWVTFHLYRRNKLGMIYTYSNGRTAVQTKRRWIK